MGLKEWLIPQDKAFFFLLESQSKNVLAGAKTFQEMMERYHDLEVYVKKIEDLEHKGDDIVHEIWEKLNRTFVTPIDREDISGLASLYDDVLDIIKGITKRLYLYEIKWPTNVMQGFANIIVRAVDEIDIAFTSLRKIREDEIQRRCVEVDRLENLADDLLNESVAALFREKDVIQLIKLKEIYELMEVVTDKCEDVSQLVRNIVIKHA